MGNTIREIVDDISSVIYNPTSVIERVLDTARSAIVNGETIDFSEPGGPLPFLLESGVAMLMAGVEHDEKMNRRAYPSMATEYLDLYDHMSDEDYYNCFAVPAPATYTMIIGKDELKNKAVPPDGKDIRKIIIPRDTSWNIAGHDFTIQYPIELRVMPHGAIQVLYDTEVASPIVTLSENALEWRIKTIEYDGVGLDFIAIDIPVLQYAISDMTVSVTNGIEFRHTFNFEDQFFCARAWMRKDLIWTELTTTHSQRIVDPFDPTVMFKVGDNELEVYIPDIYIRKGVVAGDIRIDIYTTKGKIDLDLRNYYNSEFTVNYKDLNGLTPTKYVEPLKMFTHVRYWCAEYISSGNDALTFLEQRDRVIDNSIGSRKIPISEKQLQASLNDLNYTVVKAIDMVTSRIYQAACDMPASTLSEVSTPIGTVNGILTTSFAELDTISTVKVNGNRLTILPSTLYVEADGIVNLDMNGGEGYYRALPVADRVKAINNNKLLFTPFHYVLDVNSDVLEARPYYLSNPKVSGKRFIETNASLLLDVGIGSYSLEIVNGGYRLLITTRSTDIYQTLPVGVCSCQLSFTPRGYTDQYAYLDGTFVGMADKERVYSFVIGSDMDIDRNHDILVNTFTLYGDGPTDIPLRLDADFNVIFTVNGYTTDDYAKITADTVLVNSKTNGGVNLKAVTHEVLQVELGEHLPMLWANARNVAVPMDYLRYESDVYATRKEDAYLRDVNGLACFNYDDNGKLVLVYDYRKGDTVYDADGNPVIAHKAGDVVTDSAGNPIIKEPRKLGRRIELFLLDAKYLLADTDEVAAYKQLAIDHVLTGILTDIPSVADQMHDQTDIFYVPKNTMGYVKVRLVDNTTARIDAQLSFNIRFSVTDIVRKNTDLLAAITKESRSVLMSALDTDTVSVSNILELERQQMQDDIIDVDMDKMGEDKDQPIYILTNENDKLTLGKQAVARPDGRIELRDDVNITFVKLDI